MTVASDPSAAPLMDIDPSLLAFIREQANTFIKWDIVRFFYENPHTTDTAERIARFVGRDVRVVAIDLRELAHDKVLLAESAGALTVYSLINDSALHALIARFLEAAHDRQFRMKAMYHLIKGLGR